jgi:hypothetical protein
VIEVSEADGPTIVEDYEEWLERVRATFEAVQYTCRHRLGDPALAEQVSVQVVAGLVARPAVFRYFGLPFSGRIARLAETRIVEADAGDLATVRGWTELRDLLAELPAEHRAAFVVTCVRGAGIESLATVLDCDETAAGARHEAMLAHLHEVTRPFLAALDPDERG